MIINSMAVAHVRPPQQVSPDHRDDLPWNPMQPHRMAQARAVAVAVAVRIGIFVPCRMRNRVPERST